MYVRNLLRAGDCIEAIPMGLHVTLSYNDNGNLVKIYQGYDENRFDISEKILDTVIHNRMVPLRVDIRDARTYVYGVFYTDKLYTVSGNFPQCMVDNLLNDFDSSFTFYAANVESTGVVFRGAVSTRQWLNVAGFTMLPYMLVPSNLTKASLYDLITPNNFPFVYPVIPYFCIFRNSEVLFESTGLSQAVCKSVKKYMDESGCVFGEVHLDNDWVQYIDYRDIVKYNIQSNSILIEDISGNVIYSRTDKKRKMSDMIVCPVCNKSYTVPRTGECRCDDPHCLSNVYRYIQHFLRELNLPELDYSTYKDLVENHNIITYSDILVVSPYKDMDITNDITKLIRAVIPLEYVPDNHAISQFVNKCNSSWETIKYYIQHPDRILTEFLMATIGAQKLRLWLSDNQNASDLITIIESKNVHIQKYIMKFDGPPIFRDKVIYITGRFMHGDYREIQSIIQSYHAKVVTDFDYAVNCILVGDIKENINGIALKHAKESNIPILDESNFFSQYDIDSDLKKYIF